MFSSFGQQLLNIIAPLPEDEEQTGEPGEHAHGSGAGSQLPPTGTRDPGLENETLDEVPLDDVSLEDVTAVASEDNSDPIQSALGIFRKASALLSIPTLQNDSVTELEDDHNNPNEFVEEGLDFSVRDVKSLALSEGSPGGLMQIVRAESEHLDKSEVSADAHRGILGTVFESKLISGSVSEGTREVVPRFEGSGSTETEVSMAEDLRVGLLALPESTESPVRPTIEYVGVGNNACQYPEAAGFDESAETANAALIHDDNKQADCKQAATDLPESSAMIPLELHEKAVSDLLDCEQRLKEAEEAAWRARAEASELLFALESERKASNDARHRMRAMEEARCAAEAELNEFQKNHTKIALAARYATAYERLAEISGLPADADMRVMTEAIERRLKEAEIERDLALEAKGVKADECVVLQSQLSSCRDEVESVKGSNASLKRELQNLQTDIAAREMEFQKLMPQENRLPHRDEAHDALTVENLKAEVQRLEQFGKDAHDRLEKSRLEIGSLNHELGLSKRDLDVTLSKLKSLEMELSERDGALRLVTEKNLKIQADHAEQATAITLLKQQLTKSIELQYNADIDYCGV